MVITEQTRVPARVLLLAFLLPVVLLAGCAGSRPYTHGPIKMTDPDTLAIPKPDEKPANDRWDRIDQTTVHQLEKPLDLNWTGRQIGRMLGLAGPREADNVNVLDEPPTSSWYTRRHFYHPMSPEELARGPNTTGGPDTSRTWTVISGKSEGATPGFVIRDGRDDVYLLKFDGPNFSEMGSAAEVIATKIFYAAGYHVPQNYVTYFRPERLKVGEGAEVSEGDAVRTMTEEDVAVLLADEPRTAEGTVRALASKYVDGQPLGVWEFEGTRGDDPNDRVWHEHRRELRGLRVIGSWINDADRRAANTLAVYTDEQYVKHYLIDMGGTLGSKGANTKSPLHGYEYLIDPWEITKSTLALGLYDRPWLLVDLDTAITYPSLGYFEARLFDPGRWVPTHPNPAFERATLRDAYWGAKMVMSFSDEDLEAIVRTGQLTNPAAESHLLELLRRRRDAVGRYWFSRMNPLDRFRIAPVEASPLAAGDGPAGAAASASYTLRFDDLAVAGGLVAPVARSYTYDVYHAGRAVLRGQKSANPDVPLMARGASAAETRPLNDYLASVGADEPDDRVLRVVLRTRTSVDGWPEMTEPVAVYVLFPDGGQPRVAGIERGE